VKPGQWTGAEWIIESGLAAGERVVVDGLIKVQPGIEVNPSPAGEAPVTPAPAQE
jgi:membrane fusion protein (multidrug efflux system)